MAHIEQVVRSLHSWQLEVPSTVRAVHVTAVSGVTVTDVAVSVVAVDVAVTVETVDVVVGHVPHVPWHTASTNGVPHRSRRLAQSSWSTTPPHRSRVVVVVAVVVDVPVMVVEVVEVVVDVVVVDVVEVVVVDVVVVVVDVVLVSVVEVVTVLDETVLEVDVVVVVVLVRHTPHRYGHEVRTRPNEHRLVGVASQPAESPPEHTGSASVTSVVAVVSVVVVVVVEVVVVVVVVVDVVVVAVVVVGAESTGTITPPPHAQHAVEAVCP